MRFTQTWTCTACGHAVSRSITYPKYGASERPLSETAQRARCRVCRAKACCITEVPAGGSLPGDRVLERH